MTFDKVDRMVDNDGGQWLAEMIITSWVDKYCVYHIKSQQLFY